MNQQSFALDKTKRNIREMRQTLIATTSDEKSSVFKWKVILRGQGETVFFDY